MYNSLSSFFEKLASKNDVFAKIVAAFRNDDRSSLVIKNIINSIGIKGVGILISLILIPLSINYVGAVNYGIWLTVSSVIGWMNQFDLGMGNGLRNKITGEYARKKYKKGRIYVSTTYAILTALSLLFFIVFLGIHYLVDWSTIFNTPATMSETLDLIVLIVLVCFCAQFILQIINVLLTAVHLAYKSNVIQSMALVYSLIGVLILTNFTDSSLVYLVMVLAFSPVLSILVYSVYYFARDLKFLRPSLSLVNYQESKGLFSVGGLFFIIQLGSLVLYQTSNIIIANVLGLEEVSVFNVVYKYFTALFMVVTVILNPYWSAFADAYEVKDYTWMRKSLNDLKKIFYGFIAINLLCVFISPFVFRVWLGDSLSIPFAVTLSLGLYFIVYFWYNIHVTFIYGVGKLNVEVIIIIFGALLNIPLSIYLGSLFGLVGIISSNIAVFLFLGVVTYYQVNLLINKKAVGIWNN